MTEINYQRMWDILKGQISRGEFQGVFIINPTTPLIHMSEMEELEAAAQQMESERECLEEVCIEAGLAQGAPACQGGVGQRPWGMTT